MTSTRIAPIDIDSDNFRKIGYELIDQMADFIGTIRDRPVTTGETPAQLQELLGGAGLPNQGIGAEALVARATKLLLNHSLLNGHPNFLGYITSSPAPIGMLADLLSSAVNANVGANILSPMATEIERQTVQWIAELIGVPGYDGLLVSGGNMANFTAFLAARTVKGPKQIKENGMAAAGKTLTVYCAQSTHTWIEKAAILFGLGSQSIRWIATDEDHKVDIGKLAQCIVDDQQNGFQPLMVIGNAGDVSTGAVDDLAAIARVCKAHDLWFHVDGAYGVPAAVVPAMKPLFAGIEEADSIALDPHKWLYSPLEAGCTLVKNANHLIETYSSHPVYYNFSQGEASATRNYYEFGFQNSRGFRALKVWLALQQAGRDGFVQLIGDDIRLSKLLYVLASRHAELEAISQNLSITTLRFVPVGWEVGTLAGEAYLNQLNEAILNQLQTGGKLFLSNALVKGKYCLRGCIVNFRTSEENIKEMIDIIVAVGRMTDQGLRA